MLFIDANQTSRHQSLVLAICTASEQLRDTAATD
jgi:hypothetical protein